MKITDVILFRVHGHYRGPTFPPGMRQARQIDLYPEFNTGSVNTPVAGAALQALYVEIQTDEGVAGFFGPIEEWQPFTFNTACAPTSLAATPLPPNCSMTR